jgi:hypothetical protein
MVDLEAAVPDGSNWTDAASWVQEGLQRIASLPRSCAGEGMFESRVAPAAGGGTLGLYEEPAWRRAVLATFLADHACYPSPAEQVDFARLAYVMHAFPAGFRTYWARDADGRAWPMGYAGWYPMPAATFELLANRPGELCGRRVMPEPLRPEARPWIYVFNYSVVPALRGTALSRTLIKTLAADLASVRPLGLAAITVSEDGRRIAERFGMQRRGVLRGCEEQVYTTEPRA